MPGGHRVVALRSTQPAASVNSPKSVATTPAVPPIASNIPTIEDIGTKHGHLYSRNAKLIAVRFIERQLDARQDGRLDPGTVCAKLYQMWPNLSYQHYNVKSFRELMSLPQINLCVRCVVHIYY